MSERIDFPYAKFYSSRERVLPESLSNLSGIKRGHPNPLYPILKGQYDHSVFPQICRGPSIISAIEVLNLALRSVLPWQPLSNFFIGSALLALPCIAWVYTPGAPPRASTSRPVSSAKDGKMKPFPNITTFLLCIGLKWQFLWNLLLHSKAPLA